MSACCRGSFMSRKSRIGNNLRLRHTVKGMNWKKIALWFCLQKFCERIKIKSDNIRRHEKAPTCATWDHSHDSARK